MNETQIGEVEHALRNGNRFYTESDNNDWNDLVDKGFAVKRPGWEDDMAYFVVTDEGKNALNMTTR
jgi:hypothetical protein